MRLIDSEELIDSLKFLCKSSEHNKHFVKGVQTAINIANDTPTEHVEIRAEWERTENSFRCERCGYEEAFANRYNFCPYCGANMKGMSRNAGNWYKIS